MQSDVLTDEYNKKLNEIIDYFKTEKEDRMYFLNLGLGQSKFYFNIYLSIAVILISTSNALLIINQNFINVPLNISIALIVLIAALLIMALSMINDLISSKNINKDIIHESTKYNIIICKLRSLKILPYEVDLSKLIDKIKYRFYLSTPVIANVKIQAQVDAKHIFETWFEEVRACLTEIDREILEKEKVLESTKIKTV